MRYRTRPVVALALLAALIGARPHGAAAQSELADPHEMMTVVVRFYAALERSDFKTASSYVVPEKRGAGSPSAVEFSSYYSRHSGLKFEGLVPAGKNALLARYRYQSLLGKQCQGAAMVTLRANANTWLIEKVVPSDRC